VEGLEVQTGWPRVGHDHDFLLIILSLLHSKVAHQRFGRTLIHAWLMAGNGKLCIFEYCLAFSIMLAFA